jgi:hypothetical protein
MLTPALELDNRTRLDYREYFEVRSTPSGSIFITVTSHLQSAPQYPLCHSLLRILAILFPHWFRARFTHHLATSLARSLVCYHGQSSSNNVPVIKILAYQEDWQTLHLWMVPCRGKIVLTYCSSCYETHIVFLLVRGFLARVSALFKKKVMSANDQIIVINFVVSHLHSPTCTSWPAHMASASIHIGRPVASLAGSGQSRTSLLRSR